MNKRITYYIIYTVLIIAILVVAYFCFFNKKNNNNTPDDLEEYRTVLLIANGSQIANNKLSCVVKNKKCEVTLPNIIKGDSHILGWSSENGMSATYKNGETINVESNMVLYAITYKEFTLTIEDDEVYYISRNTATCRAYNGDNECSVVLPNFNAKGFENRGYSTVKDALVGVAFPGSSYHLTKNVTVYPIYNSLTRQRTIDVVETLYGYDSIIEIERGCNDNARRSYLSYIESIKKKANYLLIGSKITFLSTETFDEIWGSNYAGMNYGPSPFRMFDIKCSDGDTNNYYGTMVHELAHTWDFNYSNYLKTNISDSSDVINIFSKYKNMKNRPFRDYSYSNIREFFADAFKYYYFKYMDMNAQYVNLDYPEDIKKVIEKYICITKNNYNEGACLDK